MERKNFIKTSVILGTASLAAPLLTIADTKVRVSSHSPSTGTLFFERVFDPTLAQTSYVIASMETKEALVVDPKRDIDTYLDIAKQNGLKITKVTETHIHADYLSGAQELASATGAELILSGETDPDWSYHIPHSPIKDGQQFQLGRIIVEAIHTPGHTPESMTFLLTDLSLSNKPQKALTGDFIFIGDVGRPDLLEKVAQQHGTQDKGARQLFASLQRFSKLHDGIEIWPGHGAGSFCGKALSDAPTSTLKDEKQNSKAFHFKDENSFVKYILDGQPDPPKYFAVMKQQNRLPRPLHIQLPQAAKLSTRQFLKARENGLVIVDTRIPGTVVKGFVPGSLHIEGSNSFATFMGSLLDYSLQFVLISDERSIEDLTRKLTRIGMDNIYGYVADIESLGLPLSSSDTVDKATFKSLLGNKDVQVIDVRSENEYKSGNIPYVENIPFSHLDENLKKINRDKTVIVHCKSGTRANMAYSILKRNGIENVKVYLGTIDEFVTNSH